MKLEIWMIVGMGITLAIGLGAVTVLLLGLHAEVRRLAKLADNAQRMLTANLRQMLPGPGATVAQARSPDLPPPRVPLAGGETPLAQLALLSAATAAVSQPAVPCSNGGPAPPMSTEASLGWNPDRRLLVMRLASRGQQPEQIASALRIPEHEVEQFLDANQLLPQKEKAL